MTRAAVTWLVAVTIATSALVASPSPVVAPTTPSQPKQVPIIQTEPNPIIRGRATWFDAERNGESTWYSRAGLHLYGAAGPALRKIIRHKWGNRYRIIVTSKETGIAVVVWVVDFCKCRGGDDDKSNDRLIDLAPAVWDAMGVPLWKGVTAITIEILPTQ